MLGAVGGLGLLPRLGLVLRLDVQFTQAIQHRGAVRLLAALGACQVISYQVWAAKLGLVIDDIDVQISGDLDVRGFFGIDPSVRPGFNAIRVEARIAGPESRERYEELTEAVERYCPVLDVLTAGVPVTSQVSYGN